MNIFGDGPLNRFFFSFLTEIYCLKITNFGGFISLQIEPCAMASYKDKVSTVESQKLSQKNTFKET